jgi:hypothetical protein
MSTLDFDRFIRELEAKAGKPAPAEPLKMVVLGKEYVLPAVVPAITVLSFWRGEEGRTNGDICAAGDVIFGREALDEWARAGWPKNYIVEAVLTAERLIYGESPERIMLSLSLPVEEEKKGSSSESTSSSDAAGPPSKPRSKPNTKST